LTNLHGDIVGILNENEELIVEYIYDVWGYIIDIRGPEADTVGRINPIRYRGYRFEEISGLYIIGGRFYSPQLGRFINPDNTMGIIGSSISHNLYAYAMNNPINVSIDPFSGTISMVFLFQVIAVSITVIFILMFALFTFQQLSSWQSSFMSAIQQLGVALNNNIAAAQSWGQQLMQKVNAANNAHRIHQTPHNTHHIVARNAARAQPARDIYLLYWISVDHPINLVGVRQSLHERLHTVMYYDTVNHFLNIANGGPSNTNRSRQVTDAMTAMRRVLTMASYMSP